MEETNNIFHVEIHLSDNQLRLMCELAGWPTDGEEFNTLQEMCASVCKIEGGLISIDPGSCCGFGADLNDILSLGFWLYNYLELTKTKLTLEDVNFHPFRKDSFPIEFKELFPNHPINQNQ